MAAWRGDILFSHEGVSGPAALEVSRTAALRCEQGDVELRLDVLPDQEFADLDMELSNILQAEPARQISTVVDRWLPNRLVEHLLRFTGVDPATRCAVLTREQRRAVVHLLKSWRIGFVGEIPITRGEVTAGGVSLDEVHPRTMASRLVPGLFLCGEILDIAGPVGGYNLQAAFSTGFVAGESAASARAAGNSGRAGGVIGRVSLHEEGGCPPEGVF
jgi:predicted Rossmann fold flavoprotein